MKSLLSNRIAFALITTLFAAATWLNGSLEKRAASTALTLTQPQASETGLASLKSAPKL